MNYQKLKERIQAAIERKPDDFAAYEDYFALCREYESVAFREAHAWNHAQRSLVSEALRRAALAEDFRQAERFDGLLFRSLLFGAPHFSTIICRRWSTAGPVTKSSINPGGTI